ncbi:maltokinase N-terminal cap-like domain-containing protein [Luteococcus peritonei]|uniref:Maltokinase n=1 Tax=Luteococcus peritonei TaxID=88874 RepID=A0ABW4S119_9ACTN
MSAPHEATTRDPVEALQDHVLGARWFAGKGREGQLVGLEQPDWIVDPAEHPYGVRAEYATVGYPDGSHEHYQLLVSYRPEPLADCLIGPAVEPELGFAHDAPRDVEAMRGVLAAVLEGSRVPHAWQQTLVDGAALTTELEPRVFGGEQSNTNVLLGDVALMKIFRKLETGPNLDIQMHDALGRAHVSSAARLFGWVSGSLTPFSDEAWTDGAEAPEPERVDLMMISELLREAHDGWELAVEHAREGREVSEHAAALGAALAEVHVALADTFGSSTRSGEELAATMQQRLERAAADAPVLAGHVAGLRRGFAGLAGRSVTAQRVHGDFHLGQCLFTADGWKIIDFEGEPMKSFAERLELDSPLRDVAGMLRSFGYATSGFDDPTGAEARAWLQDAQQAFLAAYQQEAGPVDTGLLDAYVADKAVYEVVYETRNRPDWVGIPMSAIEALAPDATTDDEEN